MAKRSAVCISAALAIIHSAAKSGVAEALEMRLCCNKSEAEGKYDPLHLCSPHGSVSLLVMLGCHHGRRISMVWLSEAMIFQLKYLTASSMKYWLQPCVPSHCACLVNQYAMKAGFWRKRINEAATRQKLLACLGCSAGEAVSCCMPGRWLSVSIES